MDVNNVGIHADGSPTNKTGVEVGVRFPSSPSNLQNKKRFTTIVGSALEVMIHEILYSRSLYPRDAFSPSRYLGVQCHACRVKGVVDYIYNTLQIAVPAICVGAVHQVAMIIYDGDGPKENVLERFLLQFDLEEEPKPEDSSTTNKSISMDRVGDLERSMRDLLLRIIINMNRGSENDQTFPGTATFKICVHTTPHPSRSHELTQALQQGTWDKSDHQHNHDIHAESSLLTRPLKSVHSTKCGLTVQLSMDLPYSHNRSKS